MESKPIELLTFRHTHDVDVNTFAKNLDGRHPSSVAADPDNDNSIASTMSPDAEKERLHKKESTKLDVLDAEEPTQETEPKRDLTKDFNIYATKKSVAQGLLDIALLTANITTLKHLLIIGRDNHKFYDFLVISLWISLTLQIILGLSLLVVGSVTKLKTKTETLNNIISVIVFIIMVLNVAISIFNDESITFKLKTCIKDLNRITNGSLPP